LSGVFEIVGPVMVGPSSSHTAGAVRLGLAGRAIIGCQPVSVNLQLHGSFAQTYRGHGTDLALVAGLLGLKPDDLRIPEALKLAEEAGLAVAFECVDLGEVHPNTVRMLLTAADGHTAEVTGSSVGGGAIEISRINQFEVCYHGEYHAVVIAYLDRPGVIAKVTTLLATEEVNIATMRVSRSGRGASALMILEMDQPISPEARALIGRIPGVAMVMAVPPIGLA
jgi:L-serine dehydratase